MGVWSTAARDLWDRAVLPFAIWNFDTCIEVQLSMIAGEYTLSSNLALLQWGSLGPLIVNAGAILHVGYSLYVRCFFCFKCIL